MLSVLLYDLNVTLLHILRGLRFLLPALGLLIKLRDYRILDVRKTEEEGRAAKGCLEMKNIGILEKFERFLCGMLPSQCEG